MSAALSAKESPKSSYPDRFDLLIRYPSFGPLWTDRVVSHQDEGFIWIYHTCPASKIGGLPHE